MALFFTLSARDYDPKLRVRVQGTGRLGFGEETANVLQLNTETFIKFVEDRQSTPILYMVVQRLTNPEAFVVRKSGKYFFLNTMRMFDALGVDYRTNTVFYNLIRFPEYDDELDGAVYRMDYDAKPANAKVIEDIDDMN